MEVNRNVDSFGALSLSPFDTGTWGFKTDYVVRARMLPIPVR